MSKANNTLEELIIEKLQTQLESHEMKDMLTLHVLPQNLLSVCMTLRDDKELSFDMLIDVCGVDYLDYGITHWRTQETTGSGFTRGVNNNREHREILWDKSRFATVYHLLSIKYNRRIRIHALMPEDLKVPSVVSVWPAANWFEREAFDLFGIEFLEHPDLRRILTDYGFKGHPFRKDFPLVGNVELRYDSAEGRCVYHPVSIQPRVNIPKVVRKDSRYHKIAEETKPTGEQHG
ncbi:MAG: NADH-quinone oxidoreductase subunit C [Gammaproteobacteria bacterium]|nr:NADH-quinone oxidoreductase subunit C [Gammaproteobacteria bacterium]MCH9743339.1 NADH-quinone oxidoreductase subunit C [Gammaproteobacteria bacterium]